MELNWLQAIFYGFIAGFTEIVPVSSRAHEAILSCLFGVERQYLLRLFLDAGALAGILVVCSGQLGRLRREQRLARLPARRRKRPPESRVLMEGKLIRMAAVPAILILLLRLKTTVWCSNLLVMAGLLVINGLILYLPERFPLGNKDARSLSPMDGVLIGVGGGLSALPGISRVGAMLSAAGLRGSSRSFALELALLLSLPALAALFVLDLILLVAAGAVGITAVGFFLCLLSGLAATGGVIFAVAVMRFLAVKIGFAGFAYYSWGAALFTFILYLIT